MYKKSKYTEAQNQEFEMRALDVLARHTSAITIGDICNEDMILGAQNTQKMARVLNSLCDKGLVKKAKSKRQNKMVYITVAALNGWGEEN